MDIEPVGKAEYAIGVKRIKREQPSREKGRRREPETKKEEKKEQKVDVRA